MPIWSPEIERAGNEGCRKCKEKFESENKRLREALEYAQKRLAKQGQEYEIIDNALGKVSTDKGA